MGLFGRKSKASQRCTECRHYAMVEGYGYCTKGLPSNVDFHFLSQDAIKRQCEKCPDEMTCSDFSAR